MIRVAMNNGGNMFGCTQRFLLWSVCMLNVHEFYDRLPASQATRSSLENSRVSKPIKMKRFREKLLFTGFKLNEQTCLVQTHHGLLCIRVRDAFFLPFAVLDLVHLKALSGNRK